MGRREQRPVALRAWTLALLMGAELCPLRDLQLPGPAVPPCRAGPTLATALYSQPCCSWAVWC